MPRSQMQLLLAGVQITGTDFTGTGDAPTLTCPADGELAPGGEVTCTATYLVTQADVDSGSLTLAAVASAAPSEGWLAPLMRIALGDISSETSKLEIASDRKPALVLTGSAAPVIATAVGQKVVYSFVATNTGNVTLTEVGATVLARLGTGTVEPVVCGDGAASLAPGANVTCTVAANVTEADATAGTLNLSAVASGTAPDGEAAAVTTDAVEVKVAIVIASDPVTPTDPGTSPSTSSSTATSPHPGATGGPAVLTDTGADIRLSGAVAALALLLGAGALVLVRRRNRANLTD